MKLFSQKKDALLQYAVRRLKLCIIIVPIIVVLVLVMFYIFDNFLYWRGFGRNKYILMNEMFLAINDAYIGCLIALPVAGFFTAFFVRDWKIMKTALVYTLTGLVVFLLFLDSLAAPSR